MAAPRSPWFLAAGLLLLGALLVGGLWLSGGSAPPSAPLGPVIIPEDPEPPAEDPRETAEDEGEPVDESLPPPRPDEARTRRALVEKLRRRFGEEELKRIAEGSVRIEDEARARHGDTEAAYEAMAAGWAAHCQKHGITEAERDALEDEAIRKGW